MHHIPPSSTLARAVMQELYKQEQHGLLFPHLGRFSICSLIPTAMDLLNLHGPDVAGLIERRSLLRGERQMTIPQISRKSYTSVLVLIIDSVSYEYFSQVQEQLDLLPEHDFFVPLCSVFPTITQVCLPSIWSAGPPSHHGIYGRLFYVPEVNETTGPFMRSARSLTEGRGDDTVIQTLLQVPSLAHALMKNGIDTRVFMTQSYPRFTSILYPKDITMKVGKLLNQESYGDAYIQSMEKKETSILSTDEALLHEIFTAFCQESEQQRLFFAHLLGVGNSAHKFQVNSPEFFEAMRGFWLHLKHYLAHLPEDCAVLLSSDHGAVPLDQNAINYFDGELLEKIEALSAATPGGNQRSAYFYAKNQDATYEMQDLLHTAFAETASVRPLTRELHHTLFGVPKNETFYQRTGNLLLLNTKNGLTHFDFDLRYKVSKVSDHGGMTPQEMMVPCVLIRR